MSSRATELLKICQKKLLADWRETLVHTAFGLSIAGLAVLLALLYAGVPIVGS